MGFSGVFPRLMVPRCPAQAHDDLKINMSFPIKIDYSGSVTSGKVAFAGGATTVTLDVLGLKSDSPVFAQVNNGNVSTAVVGIDVTTDTIEIKFDSDPGACEVAYLIFNALT